MVKWELAITTSFCFCNLILSILSCWMLHDKFPTTALVYIDGHPFSNHSAAAVHYIVYQVDRMYSEVKISHFHSMYITYVQYTCRRYSVHAMNGNSSPGNYFLDFMLSTLYRKSTWWYEKHYRLSQIKIFFVCRSNLVVRYDLNSKGWTRMPNFPVTISDHACAIYKNKVIIT